MSGDVNKIIIIGRLGKEPEIRQTQAGKSIASFSIATSKTWTKDGQRQEKTSWHKVSVMNEGLANICKKYLTKGSKVYIEGELDYNTYTDKSGIEKTVAQVLLSGYGSSLTLLDGKKQPNEYSQVNDSTPPF